MKSTKKRKNGYLYVGYCVSLVKMVNDGDVYELDAIGQMENTRVV